MNHPIVVAITGASGVIYGRRLLQVLIEKDFEIHLSISESGQKVLQHELGIDFDLVPFQLSELVPGAETTKVTYHHYKNFMAPIASGSFRTSGMVICPCSGSTLIVIATASSGNWIQRTIRMTEQRLQVVLT